MNDKTNRTGFGLFAGRKQRAGKTLTTIEQRCPAGLHAVDPLWPKCWYCEAEGSSGEATPQRDRDDPASGRGRTVVSTPAPVAAMDARGRTIVSAAPEAPGRPRRDATLTDADDAGWTSGVPDRGRTVVVPEDTRGPGGHARSRTQVDSSPDDAPASVRHAGGGRRLIGILTTFTWSRLGDLHEIRDGRNFVGSGGPAAGASAPADIVIGDDRLLSGSHFLVLCQGPRILISDNLSVNGTFVNGEQIDTRGVELADDAVIKAGATLFRFQRVLPVTE
jgi:hypothetical protein